MPAVVMHDPPPAALKAARRAVALLFLLNGLLFATWVSRLPIIQTARGLGHDDLGLGLLGMAFGALVAMPLAGLCCARFGSRAVSIFTAIGYCALLPWLAAAPGGLPFFIGLFLFGAVHGAIDVAMNAQAVEVETRYGRPIMSSFHALFSGGGLAGAALGGGFAALGVAPLPHFTLMALLLLSVTAFLSFPHLMRHAVPEPVPVIVSSSAGSRWKMPPMQLMLIGLVTFACMLGEGAMADWSAIYLREAAAAPEGIAAISYAAFSVTMMLGRLYGDRLALRHGAVKLVRAGGMLAVSGTLLALLFPQPVIALAGFAAVGAGLSTVVPSAFSAAGRVTNVKPGFALATVTTIGYFGFLLGPPAIGFVAEGMGLRAALGLVAFTSAVMIFLAPALVTRPRFQPAPARAAALNPQNGYATATLEP